MAARADAAARSLERPLVLAPHLLLLRAAGRKKETNGVRDDERRTGGWRPAGDAGMAGLGLAKLRAQAGHPSRQTLSRASQGTPLL